MPFPNPRDAEFIRTRFATELQHDVTLACFAPSTGGLVLPGQDGETAEQETEFVAYLAHAAGANEPAE